MKNELNFTLTVRYDDLNMEKRLSAPAILRYMQHAAISHSASVGNTLEKLQSVSRAWVILSWNYQEFSTPEVGEEVCVHTVATGFGACAGYRSFTISSKEGTVYAKADSVWAFYDTERLRPARVTPELLALYGMEQEPLLRDKPESVEVPESAEEVLSFRVARRDTDTNRHVNNVKYVEMALDALPEGYSFSHMRASYAHSAYEGDIMHIFRASVGEKEILSLRSDDGKVYANVEFNK